MKAITFYIGLLLTAASCVQVKQVTLFEQAPESRILPNVHGFYAVNILREQLGSEVWFTPNASCLQVRQETEQVYAGNGAFYLKWDKPEGGCEWIGMGVGWDAWTGKNLEPILHKAAIQIKAKAMKGRIQSLPLAVSLEDYAGNGAWLGVLPELIEHKEKEEWATITLPLERFSWNEFGADPGNIKQMIIQFEAAGELWVDEIEIVAYEGLRNQPYTTNLIEDSLLVIDGHLSDWAGFNFLNIDKHRVAWVFSENWLFGAGEICDSSSMANSFSGKEVIKGDGVELMLGLNPDSHAERKQLLLSDHHLFIKASDQPGVYNMRKEAQWIADARIKMTATGCGYQFETAIPLKYFDAGNIQPNKVYAMETAVQVEDKNGNLTQLRWNSPNRAGYRENPSLWGQMMVNMKKNPQ